MTFRRYLQKSVSMAAIGLSVAGFAPAADVCAAFNLNFNQRQ